jgi:hypothetical protein
MLKAMKCKKVVVCVSNDSYDAKIWTNKQHLMSRLAEKDGYFVIYIDQGLSSKYVKELWRKRKLFRLFKVFRRRKPNLVTITPLLPLIRGGVLKKISWFLLAQACNCFLRSRDVLYWIYQPQAYYFIKYLGRGRVLYDCVDEFKTQPFYSLYPKRREELVVIENKLTKIANFVTTTSIGIYEDKIGVNSNVKYIHNVGDYEHFAFPDTSQLLDEDWTLDSRQKVLFAGVVDDYKTDLELIQSVALETSKSHIYIFVGPIRIRNQQTFEKLNSIENLIFLGYRDYSIIPLYFYLADILWVPYVKSTHTERVFPLKVFEYLASRKPVIIKNLISINEYSKYLYKYEGIYDLKKLLFSVIEDDTEERKDMRQQIAKMNTWESRLEKILDFVG